ncbi:hypothetical protein H4582DRAFT_481115 [Lactarius indigo]|nr:hypothetical protein H4582DRAFT_481115 [Lactarius indigo]
MVDRLQSGFQETDHTTGVYYRQIVSSLCSTRCHSKDRILELCCSRPTSVQAAPRSSASPRQHELKAVQTACNCAPPDFNRSVIAPLPRWLRSLCQGQPSPMTTHDSRNSATRNLPCRHNRITQVQCRIIIVIHENDEERSGVVSLTKWPSMFPLICRVYLDAAELHNRAVK